MRPHHLLCIQLFQGRGYDPAFTAHMTSLVEMLQGYPETPVHLRIGCDKLCGHCPHRRGDCCKNEEKVKWMDEMTPRALSSRSGTWMDLASQAREQVLGNRERFLAICGPCEWFSLCKEEVKKEMTK